MTQQNVAGTLETGVQGFHTFDG